MTWLALDVGESRIGVAVAEAGPRVAVPVEVIGAGGGARAALARIRALVQERAVTEIVVGLPVHLDGGVGPQAETVQLFVRRLRGSVRIPIRFVDERLSTVAAQRALRAEGLRGEAVRGAVDASAAAIILQSYLDSLPDGESSQ